MQSATTTTAPTAQPAPTWYRSPAEREAYRARKQQLYAAYLDAVQIETLARELGRDTTAATARADAAWDTYCDALDRGY